MSGQQIRRRRAWATEGWFGNRSLPKTHKFFERLWCSECQKHHTLTLYATWIWKRVGKRISFNKLITESIEASKPWMENNFMAPSTIYERLNGRETKRTITLPTTEHSAGLAKRYGFLG